MLPNITIVGNTTGPAELRFTPGGKAVCNVTVVANKSKKNEQTGQWEDQGRSPFIRVAVWGDAGEALAEALADDKTARVIVTGQLLAREYEKNGEKRESVELDFATVGVIPTGSRQGGQRQAPARQPSRPPANDPWATPGVGNDEPPF